MHRQVTILCCALLLCAAAACSHAVPRESPAAPLSLQLPPPSAVPRNGSAAVVLQRNGSDYLPDLQQNCAPENEDAQLTPGTAPAGFAGLAYAIYEFNVGDASGTGELELEWTLPPEAGTTAWVGLADFAGDHWRWLPAGSTPAQFGALGDYIDADRRVLAAVVLSRDGSVAGGGTPASLHRLSLGLSQTGLGEIEIPGYDGNMQEVTSLDFIHQADGRIGLFIAWRQQRVGAQSIVTDHAQLDYVVSTDATCSAWSEPVVLHSFDNPSPELLEVWFDRRAALIGAKPAMLYRFVWSATFTATDWQVYYVAAADSSGTAWAAPQLVDSGPYEDRYELRGLAELANGWPAFTYYYGAYQDAPCYFRCATDSAGESWAEPVRLPQASGNFGTISNPIVLKGRPAVFTMGSPGHPVYCDGYLHRALDAAGTQWEAPHPVFTDWPGCFELYATVLNDGRAGFFSGVGALDPEPGGAVFQVARDGDSYFWPEGPAYLDMTKMPGISWPTCMEARAGLAFFYVTYTNNSIQPPQNSIQWNSIVGTNTFGPRREFVFPWYIGMNDATLLPDGRLLVALQLRPGDLDNKLLLCFPPDAS